MTTVSAASWTGVTGNTTVGMERFKVLHLTRPPPPPAAWWFASAAPPPPPPPPAGRGVRAARGLGASGYAPEGSGAGTGVRSLPIIHVVDELARVSASLRQLQQQQEQEQRRDAAASSASIVASKRIEWARLARDAARGSGSRGGEALAPPPSAGREPGRRASTSALTASATAARRSAAAAWLAAAAVEEADELARPCAAWRSAATSLVHSDSCASESARGAGGGDGDAGGGDGDGSGGDGDGSAGGAGGAGGANGGGEGEGGAGAAPGSETSSAWRPGSARSVAE